MKSTLAIVLQNLSLLIWQCSCSPFHLTTPVASKYVASKYRELGNLLTLRSRFDHGWLDTAVVLHCLFVILRRMKLLATTMELAYLKPPPQKHINFPPQHKGG